MSRIRKHESRGPREILKNETIEKINVTKGSERWTLMEDK